MKATDEEEARIVEEGKHAKDGLSQLSTNIQIVTVERQKIEKQVLAEESNRTTVSKAVRNLQKQAAGVKDRTHDLEIQQAHLENELSRIKVDALNTAAHNAQLKDTLEGMVSKLREQDDLILKYQSEIRQRNDDIEKKMYRVDRLNRKYEKMMEGQEDEENLGPLEATIKSLKADIEAEKEEAGRLEGVWLADQTRLVESAQAAETTLEANAELRARGRILNERRLQLLKDGAARAAEVQGLEHSIKGMRADVARLNDLLGRHATQQESLANETAVLEMEFQSELRELEEASLKTEQKVHDAKAAKAGLLEEVIDTERQVLLWEKKIQLERETQAALDPEVGTSEIKAMEIEIHRERPAPNSRSPDGRPLPRGLYERPRRFSADIIRAAAAFSADYTSGRGVLRGLYKRPRRSPRTIQKAAGAPRPLSSS